MPSLFLSCPSSSVRHSHLSFDLRVDVLVRRCNNGVGKTTQSCLCVCVAIRVTQQTRRQACMYCISAPYSPEITTPNFLPFRVRNFPLASSSKNFTLFRFLLSTHYTSRFSCLETNILTLAQHYFSLHFNRIR